VNAKSINPVAKNDLGTNSPSLSETDGSGPPRFLKTLRQGEDGVFHLRQGTSEISYPEEGHELTAQVEEKSFWFQHRNRVISHLLTRYHHQSPLLDIGGGNGLQARYLQPQTPVVMVEPGAAGCNTAKTRGVKWVVQSTLEALSLPDASVDALSFFDVLEHLDNPQGILRECHRILKPGGNLFVTVPAFQFLWCDEDIYADHKRRYTVPSLAKELTTPGFELSYISYYFQFLLLPLFLLRTLPYKLSRKNQQEEFCMDQTEHLPSPMAKKVLDFFLDRELKALQRGNRLRFGTSVISVARKPE
jgi:ubiquinone/menaquinone biosynthesis C-methylase UbiE